MSTNFKITAFRRPDPVSDKTTPELILEVISTAYSISPTLVPSSSRALDTTFPSRVLEIHFSTAGTNGAPFKLADFRDRADEVLDSVEDNCGFDLVFQQAPDSAPTEPLKTPPKLAIFDMDSTLIQQEVIDLLAAHAGVSHLVSEITARAMNGELDFYASLRERVALLKGIPVSVFEELKPQLLLTTGAETLLRVLKKVGAKTALLSGGFLPLARHIGGRLSIDHIHANSLAVDPATQTLTGELEEGAEIVHAERKRELLLEIAAQEGLDLTKESDYKVLAVGDGANDLPMMWAASLGVAVHAKPVVQKKAPVRLNTGSLADLLYLMGYSEAEIEQLGSQP
ncbi:hypothetical protein FH972_023912 [Carpinus fangiana]|uniref:phosphoserine phosphatase n=1 Tax=Carpinus fangiana TaxID=176857 RepID=A0A5N6KX73_9ROSI|nr:hypothetical protein FH972_023912 [Carpinus fangiana]